ncbi:MAG: SRPBCC family protein [Bdellovibrionota bacterium]
MNWLRKSLVFGFGLVFLALIIAAVLPPSFEVERSVMIEAPVMTVYDSVANFDRWEKWGPWFFIEPDATFRYEGEMGYVGSKHFWDGNLLGKGSVTMLDVNPGESLRMLVRFEKPWSSTMLGEFFFESLGKEKCKVTWVNEGDLSYPIMRILGVFAKKKFEHQFEQGLQNLKKLHEPSST